LVGLESVSTLQPPHGADDSRRSHSRRVTGIELGVFLLLIAPQFFLSAIVDQRAEMTFTVAACAVILRDIGFVALIFLFLARNGERRDEIGWTFKKGHKYITLGMLTFPLLLYGMTVLQMLLRDFGLSMERHVPSYLMVRMRAELPLLGFMSLINGVAEEIIFRGYLMLRLTALSGRTWAVLLSSAVFGLEHLYQGRASVASITCMGVVFALVAVRTRSLVIPIVWHCLQDFVAILLASSIR